MSNTSITFNKPIDFLSFKDHCVFCGSKLKPLLKSFIKRQQQPMIKSKLVDDNFCFNIKNTNSTYSFDADISLDINTNIINFELNSPCNLENPLQDHLAVKNYFDILYLHLELYCPSRKCNMQYYLCTNLLSSQSQLEVVGKKSSVKLKPNILFMEAFIVNKSWVQNLWENHELNIYSTDNIDSAPIKAPFMDLSVMNKERVINRIRTIVTFS